MTKINERGEFGLIREIAERFRDLVPEGWEGIGDDCAVIPWGESESLVITTDLLVEGVHFLRERITPAELGYKSLAVNLSDIAAMGARPVATFLSIGLPPQTEAEWCDRFFEGYRSLDVPLLGGDTTSSRQGIVINVTVLGTVANAHIKRRNSARPGDLIAVTGPLGDSGAGLRILLERLPSTPDTDALVRRHHNPRPHLAEGEWLGTQPGVHAMMDLSDGLASDLLHILKASDCAAEVETTRLPLSPELQKAAAQYSWNTTGLAVGSGEDYVLLLTLKESESERICREFQARFGTPLHIVGRITEDKPGIDWKQSEGKPGDYRGYNHF